MGCVSVVVRVFVLWVLVFGITLGGKHYGLSLDCNKGVVVE